MNLLIIDNFDSFTYNLVQQLAKVAGSISDSSISYTVVRNNGITIDEITSLKPSHIIISPGPGDSSAGGISKQILPQIPQICPILGVCLGMQLMAAAEGAKIIKANRPVHGHQDLINHTKQSIFSSLDSDQLKVARYHSLMVDTNSINENIIPLAYSKDQTLMALKHRTYPWIGLQFHPESFLTEDGDKLIENFLLQRF